MSQPAAALASTLRDSRLVIFAGSGGVGKTTSSAALALHAALSGRRVLVLTIDPARRLLQALGLHGEHLPSNTPLEVLPLRRVDLPADALDAAGQVRGGGTLHAMMLDAETGAVDMVERLLPTPELRDRVMNNRIYRAFLPALSASPDYMALELISHLMRDARFDLLVLDTPPMHNALDFLHAGGTLAAFINERVLKWFAKVPVPGQKSRFSLLSAGTSMAMTVLGRLLGNETLPDIAEFFASFQDVLPRLRERANETDLLLRSPRTRFVVVTTPGETSLREARHLYGELREQKMHVAGFIVNRVIRVPRMLADPRELGAAALHLREPLCAVGMSAADVSDLTERLVQAAARLRHLGEADEAHVLALQRLAGPDAFCTVATQREDDIHTLAELRDLGARLLDAPRPDVLA